MKKSVFIFAVIVCFASCLAQAAVNIKKASPVATKKTEAVESATSLLPTVVGLVSSVSALSAQQKALTADCAPTSDEIKTVNDLVKEWAKIGDTSAENAVSGLGDKCPDSFEEYVKYYSVDDKTLCYEVFDSESSDAGMVWHNFPKASYYNKCDSGTNKNCQVKTNMYDIFSKISIGDGDYTVSEAKKITALKEKAQRCAPGKTKAAARELAGNFLTQTLSNVGQSSGASGTSSVIETVSSLGGSGNIKDLGTSLLPSIGQMFDK